MAEILEKRPMGRRKLLKYTQPVYRIYVCHIDENSVIYLLAKTIYKQKKQYTTVELMNKEEIKVYKKLQQNFAIVISVKQFESIMALYNGTKMLAEYLIKESLLTKNIPLAVREPIK